MSGRQVSSGRRFLSPLSTGLERASRHLLNGKSHGIIPGLLFAYLGYVVLFTLAPFTFTLGESDSIVALFRKKFEGFSGISRATPWDIWTNVVFFVPCGFLVVLLPRVSSRAWSAKMLLASGVAVLLSCGVEVTQLFVPRAPSVADILCNVLGGVVGGILGLGCHAVLQTYGRGWWQGRWTKPTLTLLVISYVAFLSVAIVLPITVARDFRNWDPTYRLFLGNEGTLDRPWQGTMHLVALYDHALTPDEVRMNFSAGPSVGAREKRTDQGLLLYYDFSENNGDMVRDRSGFRPAIDLRIVDRSRTTWVVPNGLLLEPGAVVSSVNPPQKLAPGRFGRSQLSLEAWITPGDLAQVGPARIISYSVDPYARNFTLGQQNREVIFRLRTPVSGLNGAQPALSTDDSPLDLAIQHVVATYRDGIETLYLNGAEHARILVQKQVFIGDWIVQQVGEPFRWLVWSVLIFPLGILSRLCCPALPPGIGTLVSFGIALIALLLIHSLRIVTFEASIDLLFMSVGAHTLLASVLLVPSPYNSL